jgi:hypothetical protein
MVVLASKMSVPIHVRYLPNEQNKHNGANCDPKLLPCSPEAHGCHQLAYSALIQARNSKQ